jgi:uncharacterized membrane protein
LGLLSTAAIFDVLYVVTGQDGFATAAFYAIAAGVIGGLLAGLFGFLDFLAVPQGTRAKRVGVVHGVGNVIALALFVLSWLPRVGEPANQPGAVAVVLSVLGALLGSATGWFGGELVERLRVGVDDGANVDAPNSRPAVRGRVRGW